MSHFGAECLVIVLLEDDWGSEVYHHTAAGNYLSMSQLVSVCYWAVEKRKSVWQHNNELTGFCNCCGDNQWVVCLDMQGGAEYIQ